MTVTAEQYKTDCSKYVYDSGADKLTLPNATGRALMGGESVKSIEAGLPNITGELVYWGGTVFYGSGAFLDSQKKDQPGLAGGDDKDNTSALFDASKSNPIYGASDTVQPPAISLIAQVKY